MYPGVPVSFLLRLLFALLSLDGFDAFAAFGVPPRPIPFTANMLVGNRKLRGLNISSSRRSITVGRSLENE